MANKGEWGEPYAAIRILGDGKLYIADADGNRNPNEWMSVIELIRHETLSRVVTYKCNITDITIDIFVNGNAVTSIGASLFIEMADKFAEEIRNGKGSSFDLTPEVVNFLHRIEIFHIKAKSIDKSDVFLTVCDPRASITRKHIGFSIKSEFGQNPTLFNTAKASAVIYKITGMTDDLMDSINGMVDCNNHAAVSDRCDALIGAGCELTFIGFPIPARSNCATFMENLDMINPRLPKVIEQMLWNHFFNHDTRTDLNAAIQPIIERNPCRITRPEEKYPNMIMSFLYAAYCGMTASTLWDGKSQVNGGFIKVKRSGEVLAHYALESDAFKSYLYSNCYLEFPSTDEGHGHYAKVYKEGSDYFFRLNFQIRYR